MSETNSGSLYELHAEMCKVFTSPKRLELLNLLRKKELSVGELTELAGISQSGVSQHLAILKGQDIVRARRVGSRIYYSLSDKRIGSAFDIIRGILLDKLNRMASLSRVVRKSR